MTQTCWKKMCQRPTPYHHISALNKLMSIVCCFCFQFCNAGCII